MCATVRCCAQLLAYVQSPEGEELRAPVTAALQRFGGGRFDRLTQTDAVHKLTSDLSGESVKAYVASLKATFMTGERTAVRLRHASKQRFRIIVTPHTKLFGFV